MTTEQIIYIYVLLPLAAYSIGAVPFGLILCMVVKGVDIREHGSKNIGATNAGRVCGKPLGIAAFILDFGKGLVAVLGGLYIVRLSGAQVDEPLAGIAYGACAIIGHSFPAYLGFKGGKAVATGFGVFVGLAPVAALIAFGIWIILFLIFRYVSLASIIAAIAAPVVYAIQYREDIPGHLPVLIFAISIALLIIIRHRSNIGRLLSGTESKLESKK